MSPARFNECLTNIHWSTKTLAGILGCDDSLTGLIHWAWRKSR